MSKSSLRYGGGSFDLRSIFFRLCGILQRKKVVILKSNPELCGEVLAASDTKGTFIEHLIAIPAWSPIHSIESVDGDLWQGLALDFRKVFSRICWRERLVPITHKYVDLLLERLKLETQAVVDSEEIARITLRIMFELLFETEISKEDELLFYRASLEWRKEIGMKGVADPEVKIRFWQRLSEVTQTSKFKEDLLAHQDDPSKWLSVFAQPFLISPQINLSDIMVAVFQFLRHESKRLEEARHWVNANDKARLSGIILESIRLQHPFPLLEREMTQDVTIQGQTIPANTQVFIVMDQFKQDQEFNPERWLPHSGANPYHAIPFGMGPRMCAGKPLAIDLMVELLKAFLTRIPDEKIKPQLGHLYSGRDNDKSLSLAETLYQLKTILRGIWNSLLIGLGKKPMTGVCPWKQAMKGRT